MRTMRCLEEPSPALALAPRPPCGSARAAEADARSQTAAASARHCNGQTAIDPVENLAHADYGTWAKSTAVAAGFQPPRIFQVLSHARARAPCVQDIGSK